MIEPAVSLQFVVENPVIFCLPNVQQSAGMQRSTPARSCICLKLHRFNEGRNGVILRGVLVQAETLEGPLSILIVKRGVLESLNSRTEIRHSTKTFHTLFSVILLLLVVVGNPQYTKSNIRILKFVVASERKKASTKLNKEIMRTNQEN